MADTIAEFMVSLGFDLKKSQQQDFQKGVQGATASVAGLEKEIQGLGKELVALGQKFVQLGGKPAADMAEYTRKTNMHVTDLRKGFVELGRQATVIGTGFVAAIREVAKSYQQLYYDAQRAGTTASSLAGLEFAFQQVGHAGGQATATVVAMNDAFRESPGLAESMGRFFGTSFTNIAKNTGTVTDRTREYINLLFQAAKMEGEIDVATRDRAFTQMGLNAAQVEQDIKNREIIRRENEFAAETAKRAGVDIDKLGKDEAELFRTIGEIGKQTFMIWSKVEEQLMPTMTALATAVENFMNSVLDFNKKEPWAPILVSIAMVSTAAGAALTLLRSVAAMAGLARGAAAVVAPMAVGGGIGAAIAGGIALKQAFPTTEDQPDAEWRRMIRRRLDVGPEGDESLAPLKKFFGSRFDFPEVTNPSGEPAHYQRGGIVSMLHEGEQVLPADIAHPMKRANEMLLDWFTGSLTPKIKIESIDPGALGGAEFAGLWGGAGFGQRAPGTPALWGGGSRRGYGGGDVADTANYDLTGNAFIASQRAGFKAELEKNPELKLRLAAITELEDPANKTAVPESLFNRLAMMHKGLGYQGAGGMFGGAGSFFGPVRRGAVEPEMAELQRDPKRLSVLMSYIDAAVAGSNLIKMFTDQGSPGDPNYMGGGRGVTFPNSERYNIWGVPGAAEWTRGMQEQVLSSGGGGSTINQGDKTVNMTVNHTINLVPGGAADVSHYMGAGRRLFGDTLRDAKAALG